MWPWARSFYSLSPFLCEEPACRLRFRLLSPSLSKLQVFRPEPCVALRDLKVCLVCVWGAGGVLLEQPDVIKCENLGSSGNLQLWP